LTICLLLAGCGGDSVATERASVPAKAKAKAKVAGAWIADGPSRSATVWAVGDGDGGSDSDSVVRLIERSRFSRVLYLGDVYEEGTAAEFREGFAPTFGRLARRIAPTAGNHEWPNHRAGYDPYWRKVHGSAPPLAYAFRIAGWQVLSVNSESDARASQLRWLTRKVSGGGTCRIAFWHTPRRSAGNAHGDAPRNDNLWQAVVGRARIVIGGHDHDMQRFAPVGGTTEFVSGAGGHGLYSVSQDSRLRFSDDENYGALRLQLRPRRATWAFVAVSGRVLDSGTLRCTP
jgi:hypothetical protein